MVLNFLKRSIKNKRRLTETLEKKVTKIAETVGPLELEHIKNHFHHNIKIFKTAVKNEP